MNILSAALPEFLGALAATLVTALCSRGVQHLKARRRPPTVRQRPTGPEVSDPPAEVARSGVPEPPSEP
ncbi:MULTISPECIES: hypothetical protein [Streptomyces]|uniref:Uncharacterized protein n=1 Tax=Streptomyces yunnanensis TaxID=156453 RepID=A0A9X8N4F3_9ACTN|nr:MULTISPECIES: hypothetical protein [Streptomyces]SHM92771.1 hypothetical protein SAMN05216268_116118 [Streptomyces yunnanensis]